MSEQGFADLECENSDFVEIIMISDSSTTYTLVRRLDEYDIASASESDSSFINIYALRHTISTYRFALTRDKCLRQRIHGVSNYSYLGNANIVACLNFDTHITKLDIVNTCSAIFFAIFPFGFADRCTYENNSVFFSKNLRDISLINALDHADNLCYSILYAITTGAKLTHSTFLQFNFAQSIDKEDNHMQKVNTNLALNIETKAERGVVHRGAISELSLRNQLYSICPHEPLN